MTDHFSAFVCFLDFDDIGIVAIVFLYFFEFVRFRVDFLESLLVFHHRIVFDDRARVLVRNPEDNCRNGRNAEKDRDKLQGFFHALAPFFCVPNTLGCV